MGDNKAITLIFTGQWYLMTEFYLIQHGEKAGGTDDPPLTKHGIVQAERTAMFLCDRQIDFLISSPARRARETAARLQDQLGLPIEIDRRLRERMEWSGDCTQQSSAAFLREWVRATAERDFRTRSGDSSYSAGARLHTALEDLALAQTDMRIALVTHGGVTLDLLRNLFCDTRLEFLSPGLITAGPSGCAITHLRKIGGKYEIVALCSTEHLANR